MSITFRLQRSVMATVRIYLSLRKTVLIMVQDDSEHLTRLGYIPLIHVRLFLRLDRLLLQLFSLIYLAWWYLYVLSYSFSIMKIHSQLTQRHQL